MSSQEKCSALRSSCDRHPPRHSSLRSSTSGPTRRWSSAQTSQQAPRGWEQWSTSQPWSTRRSRGTRATTATTWPSRSTPPQPSASRRAKTLRILFVADVVGRPGRRALEERLPALRTDRKADICVVNGENAADGVGITPRLANRLLAVGADAITLGNHAFRRAEIGPYLDSSDRIVRPANASTSAPGRGLAFVSAANGTRLAVINVLGSLFLHPSTSMFEVIDGLIEDARGETPLVLVDIHAEATSEKVALALWLDGRATAVVGTHTHVQTSDARVLPLGTAFITDAGMTGPHDSVIGVEADLAIKRMRTGLPVRFETAQGGVRIEGVVIDCDAHTGRATAIEPFRISYP
jgi:metallophosphoesterase (TIGR00282 family)